MQAHQTPSSIAVVSALALTLAGCSGGPAPGGASRSVASPSPPQSVAGVHSERIALRHHDAGDVSSMLRQVLDLPRSTEVRAILDEPGTNEIVVVGTDAGIATVRRLLAPGLAGEPGDRGVEVIALAHADARDLVHAVERVGPRDVELIADQPTNSLVVEGPVASRKRVADIARSLDTPGK